RRLDAPYLTFAKVWCVFEDSTHPTSLPHLAKAPVAAEAADQLAHGSRGKDDAERKQRGVQQPPVIVEGLADDRKGGHVQGSRQAESEAVFAPQPGQAEQREGQVDRADPGRKVEKEIIHAAGG